MTHLCFGTNDTANKGAKLRLQNDMDVVGLLPSLIYNQDIICNKDCNKKAGQKTMGHFKINTDGNRKYCCEYTF